jgi:NhaA family Na+:H+ antiporter
MPIFALANAGVVVGVDFFELLTSKVSLGIALGLLVGKFIGVFGAGLIMLRSGLGKLPEGLTLKHLAALSVLAGIGFTMSLFIADLAFADPLVIRQARIGILTSSLIAALAGYFTVRTVCKGTGDIVDPEPVSSSTD